MTVEESHEKPASSRWRKCGIWLLRLAGTAIACALVVRTLRGSHGDLSVVFRMDRLGFLLAAFLFQGIPHVLASLRWQRLLATQGCVIPYWLSLKLTLTGQFFNAFIPGTVSGDILKVGFVLKNAPGRRLETTLSIVLDRLIGLTGQFTVALVFVPLLCIGYYSLVCSNPVLLLAVAVIVFGAFSLLLAGCLLFNRRRLPEAMARRCPRCIKRMTPRKLKTAFGHLVAGADAFGRHPAVLLQALLLSMVIHGCLGVCTYFLGKACGEQNMSPVQYMLTTQIGNIATAIPVTPGGTGVRDTVSAAMLAAFHASPESAVGGIPVLYTLLLLLWALIGAAIFIVSPDFKAMVRHPQETADAPSAEGTAKDENS